MAESIEVRMENKLEWGRATHSLPGETASGDQSLVVPLPQGTLAAAIDGLGHGNHAQIAALKAVEVLKAHPHDTLPNLLQRCHENLRSTRGVVMSLAWISKTTPTLTWIGVGNVRGLLIHPQTTNGTPRSESLLLRGGIVGYNLPPSRPVTLPLTPGDILILATDGIRNGFSENLPLHLDAQNLSNHILHEHALPNDDALVLVLRYLGQEA